MTGVDRNELRPSGTPANTSSSTSSTRDRRLFIGGLSWDTSDEKFKQYFEQFGALEESMIMRDKLTGQSRGFGFVTFVSPDPVQTVLSQSLELDGRQIDPKIAVRKEEMDKRNACLGPLPPREATERKLFVGSIPPEVSQEAFKTYFEGFGPTQEAVVMKGYGFVRFEEQSSVEAVLNQAEHIISGHRVEPQRAIPRRADRRPAPPPRDDYSYGGAPPLPPRSSERHRGYYSEYSRDPYYRHRDEHPRYDYDSRYVAPAYDSRTSNSYDRRAYDSRYDAYDARSSYDRYASYDSGVFDKVVEDPRTTESVILGRPAYYGDSYDYGPPPRSSYPPEHHHQPRYDYNDRYAPSSSSYLASGSSTAAAPSLGAYSRDYALPSSSDRAAGSAAGPGASSSPHVAGTAATAGGHSRDYAMPSDRMSAYPPSRGGIPAPRSSRYDPYARD